MMTIIMLILATIGIVATIVGVVYASKRGSKVGLTYIDEDCISLFKSLVESIDGIEVTYKEKSVDPSLIVLQGSFVNTGNLDIDESSVHEPLSLKLPDGYEWLEVKMAKSSPGSQAKCSIRNKSTVEFGWDLLKKDEFFGFNSLVKAPPLRNRQTGEDAVPPRRLSELISFSHRITDLRRIQTQTTSANEPSLFAYAGLPRILGIMGKLWFLFLIYIALGIVIMSLSFITPARTVNYLLEEPNGNVVEVTVSPRANDRLKIEGTTRAFSETIPAKELFSKYRFTGSSVGLKETSNRLSFYMGLGLTLLAGFVVAVGSLFKRKKRRLAELMRTEGR